MYNLSGKMISTILIIGVMASMYGATYLFILANISQPELNRAQALLSNARGSTNLSFMAEQLEASTLIYGNKKANPAWIVQTSWTDYDSIRADTLVLAKYCRELQAKLEKGGALPSGDYTYYSQAIEKIQSTDIYTLQRRINDCFQCETVGSRTALTQTSAFIGIWFSILYLLCHFNEDIDHRGRNWGKRE